MTDSGPLPGEIERIAAFLDRTLPEDERAELLDRLDRDEALYETFLETVRHRDQAGRKVDNAVEHPAARDRSHWMGAAAIAAMLALGVVWPFAKRSAMTEPAFALALAEDLTLERALREGWYQQGWRTFRETEPTGDELEAAFRSGVRALELELALRLGRMSEAETLTGSLGHELRGLPFIDRSAFYEEMHQQLSRGSAEEALRTFFEIDSVAREGFGASAPNYSFGKWAEAGRLAAQTENQDLLRSRPFREALHSARAHEQPPELEEQLELIASQIDQRGAALDFQELLGAFQAIIGFH